MSFTNAEPDPGGHEASTPAEDTTHQPSSFLRGPDVSRQAMTDDGGAMESSPPTEHDPAVVTLSRTRASEHRAGRDSATTAGSCCEPGQDSPAPRVLVCPGCGSTFETRVPDKVFCADRCKQRAKRRRRAARRPPAPPAPRESLCGDCGTRLVQPGPGPLARRCVPCKAVRALERDREARRRKHAAVAAVAGRKASGWRRWLSRWSRC